MYDYLIISAGVTANFFGVPGAPEYSMPLYRRTQALALRDKVFAVLEEAAVNGQDRDLRIVVVGGATGVEMAGALTELRDNDFTSPIQSSPRHAFTSHLSSGSRSCWRRSIRRCGSTPAGHYGGVGWTCGSIRK